MRRKTLVLLVPALVAMLGVATYSRSAGGSTDGTRAKRALSYSRMASAPPAPPTLASNPRVQAMARLAGVDPAGLRQLHPADQPLGALLAGRGSKGEVCVAEASADVAGSFQCDPFRHGPLVLISGSRGTPSQVTWSGFVGVADASVGRLVVRTAAGSARDVSLNPAGAFSYGASDPSAFPVELDAYAADGRLVLSAPLARAAPPALG